MVLTRWTFALALLRYGSVWSLRGLVVVQRGEEGRSDYVCVFDISL